jgi:hypothetical protein
MSEEIVKEEKDRKIFFLFFSLTNTSVSLKTKKAKKKFCFFHLFFFFFFFSPHLQKEIKKNTPPSISPFFPPANFFFTKKITWVGILKWC